MKRLAVSLGMAEDHAYSCETAGHFYHSTILPRMEMMKKVLMGKASESEVEVLRKMPLSFSQEQATQWKEWNEMNTAPGADCFPFKLFFMDQPQPLFSHVSS